jgi:hypothetical protein
MTRVCTVGCLPATDAMEDVYLGGSGLLESEVAGGIEDFI